MVFGTIVFAAGETKWECSVEADFSGNRLVAEGCSAANTTVAVMVLPRGKKPADVWELSAKTDKTASGSLKNGTAVTFSTASGDPTGVLSFISQFKTGADGSFAINIGISESGIYDVWFLPTDTNEMHQYPNVEFVNSEDYNDAVDKLNEKINDKAAFVALFDNSALLSKLGFKSSEKAQAAAEILFAHRNGKKLPYDYEENKALYECCEAIAGLNDKESVDINRLLYSKEDDADFIAWYNQYIKIETAEKYFIDKISGKSIGNLKELADELTGALILYVVENPDGYENIREIFADFPQVTGISSPTTKNSVFSSLAGEKFNDITALVSRYNELAKQFSSQGGSAGGGNFGIGGSSRGLDLEIYGSQRGTVEPMNKDIFEDLESVPWAKDAIVELAARNVIAGKGGNKFCPDDMVTREEFTKLVTAAFISDVEEAEIAFADVLPNRWSYRYIAKAKAAGLINGYSETEFGAEDLISRQDMAVIIYNTAVYKNVELASASDALTFADDSEISDYAKESVYMLKAMGIINGVSDMEFAPVRNATRAEAAVIIYALLQK